MKKSKLWTGVLAITLVFAMTAVGCDNDPADDNNGGGGKIDYTADSISGLAAWLSAQPANTPATAYNIKLNVSALGGNPLTDGSVGNALNENDKKYVRLDLSGSTITSIEENAFFWCESLTGVTIPNSVTSIGDWAFGYCTGLASITIPNSVTSIGWRAFAYCTSLASITIPNSVTSIGGWAFDYCTSLASVTIPNSVTFALNNSCAYI